jgi:hypothetical protein
MGHLPSLSIQDLLDDLGVQDYLSPVPITATAGVSDNVCIPTCSQCITPPAPCTHEYQCEQYSYWKQNFPDFSYLLDDGVEEPPVEDSKPVHVHTCRPVITKSIFRIPGPTAPLGFYRNRRARLEAQGLVGVPFKVWFHNQQFHKSNDLKMPVPYRGELQQEYQAEVCRFLKGMGLRIIRELGYNPRDMTDEAAQDALVVVAEEVLKRAEQAAGPRLVGERPKGYKTSVWDPLTQKHERVRTTTGQVWDQWLMDVSRSAAALAWEDYRPEYMAERSAWGRTGGRKSKRPRVFTVDMLIPYAHLTRPEQMAKLKCSKSVIARLRRELKALSKLEEKPADVAETPAKASETSGIEDFREPSAPLADSKGCERRNPNGPPLQYLYVAVPRADRGRRSSRGPTFTTFAGLRRRGGVHSSSSPLPRGPGCRRRSARGTGSVSHHARHANARGGRHGERPARLGTRLPEHECRPACRRRRTTRSRSPS